MGCRLRARQYSRVVVPATWILILRSPVPDAAPSSSFRKPSLPPSCDLPCSQGQGHSPCALRPGPAASCALLPWKREQFVLTVCQKGRTEESSTRRTRFRIFIRSLKALNCSRVQMRCSNPVQHSQRSKSAEFSRGFGKVDSGRGNVCLL